MFLHLYKVVTCLQQSLCILPWGAFIHTGSTLSLSTVPSLFTSDVSPALGIIVVGPNGAYFVDENSVTVVTPLMSPLDYDALTRTYYGVRSSGVVAVDAFGAVDGERVSQIFQLRIVSLCFFSTHSTSVCTYVRTYVQLSECTSVILQMCD